MKSFYKGVAYWLLWDIFAYITFSELGQAKLKGQQGNGVLCCQLSIYYVDVGPLVSIMRNHCVLYRFCISRC